VFNILFFQRLLGQHRSRTMRMT